MKNYQLNYYPLFKCVAGECKHTCCAGWEMLIDADSLCAYKNDDSAFREALNKGINYNKSKFKSDGKGRCAFLNGDGLCDIIINLGENSLCQVCRDHPRFRSFFEDRTETGLGFCCEEATRIILSFKDKIQPVLISDDGNDEPVDFISKSILEFREKALTVLQERGENINDRIDDLLRLSRAEITRKDFNKILKKFLSFERLGTGFTKRLKKLKGKPFNTTTSLELSLVAEQFLVNSVYRHFHGATDAISVRARAVSCVICWWIINNLILNECDDKNALYDIVRDFSAEVEYSQKNLDKLFSFTLKFIKI